jgi:threonine dehydrogenase-like Zn-dependent dehydrogenase
MQLKPINQQVVAIVGASSGIGRETAIRFAKKGAKVVVSARSQPGLESLISEIKSFGGDGISVIADVADFGQVKAIADRAVEQYGRLDTWVHHGIPDEKILPISDAFPTGFMGADMCDIQPGDIVAVWGCGPVGLFAMRSAYMLGAERVIAIDRVPERLQMARDFAKAETINYEEIDAGEALKEMTGGRGPDACIDAVGLEAHGMGLEGFFDEAKQTVRLETDRPPVLRQMMVACRKGGTLSIMGVYGGFVDKMPMGAAFNKSLNFKMGQMHGQKYMPMLLEKVVNNEIDPSQVFTHTLPLAEAKQGFEIFKHKKDNCIKVLLKP